MTQAPDATTTVWFDGACPVCSREIAFYQGRDGADRLRFVDIARCGDDALPPGIGREEALARFHVSDGSGAVRSGAAGFAALWRALPGFALAGRIASLPGVVHALELGYRLFLKARRLWRRPSVRAAETAPRR